MRRMLKRVIVVTLLVPLMWVAGLTAWRLRSDWTFFFLAPQAGEILGTHNGVSVYAYGSGGSVRGDYGLEYECVELVNRYYVQVLGHRNMTKTGHAESYYWDAREKGLIAYNNGESVAPSVHDILVFDGGQDDGSVGHVAIVVEVDKERGSITFIEQNMIAYTDWVFRRDIWKDTLPLTHLDGEWFVDQRRYTLPVVGWSRIAPPTTRTRSAP